MDPLRTVEDRLRMGSYLKFQDGKTVPLGLLESFAGSPGDMLLTLESFKSSQKLLANEGRIITSSAARISQPPMSPTSSYSAWSTLKSPTSPTTSPLPRNSLRSASGGHWFPTSLIPWKPNKPEDFPPLPPPTTKPSIGRGFLATRGGPVMAAVNG